MGRGQEIITLQSVGDGQGFVRCSCKLKCDSMRCKCRSEKRICNSACHKNNSSCVNHDWMFEMVFELTWIGVCLNWFIIQY